MWPVGQAVKTAASHAANGSSILPRVTTSEWNGLHSIQKARSMTGLFSYTPSSSSFAKGPVCCGCSLASALPTPPLYYQPFASFGGAFKNPECSSVRDFFLSLRILSYLHSPLCPALHQSDFENLVARLQLRQQRISPIKGSRVILEIISIEFGNLL